MISALTESARKERVMKIPKYIVIRLDTKNHGTTVTATDISDRCEVIEYEAEQTEPQDWKDQMWAEAAREEGDSDE